MRDLRPISYQEFTFCEHFLRSCVVEWEFRGGTKWMQILQRIRPRPIQWLSIFMNGDRDDWENQKGEKSEFEAQTICTQLEKACALSRAWYEWVFWFNLSEAWGSWINLVIVFRIEMIGSVRLVWSLTAFRWRIWSGKEVKGGHGLRPKILYSEKKEVEGSLIKRQNRVRDGRSDGRSMRSWSGWMLFVMFALLWLCFSFDSVRVQHKLQRELRNNENNTFFSFGDHEHGYGW